MNATIFCVHILAERNERNIKASTAESKVKTVLWLSRYPDNKPFEQWKKQDILSYLNSLRKPFSVDQQQRWRGPSNNRLPDICKFYRWLYNKDEPDYRKRTYYSIVSDLWRQVA